MNAFMKKVAAQYATANANRPSLKARTKAWDVELAYCRTTMLTQDYGKSFNGDPECFYRYAVMQSNAAKREGFFAEADLLQDIASQAIGWDQGIRETGRDGGNMFDAVLDA